MHYYREFEWDEKDVTRDDARFFFFFTQSHPKHRRYPTAHMAKTRMYVEIRASREEQIEG